MEEEEDEADMEDWEMQGGILSAQIIQWDSVQETHIEDEFEEVGKLFPFIPFPPPPFSPILTSFLPPVFRNRLRRLRDPNSRRQRRRHRPLLYRPELQIRKTPQHAVFWRRDGGPYPRWLETKQKLKTHANGISCG